MNKMASRGLLSDPDDLNDIDGDDIDVEDLRGPKHGLSSLEPSSREHFERVCCRDELKHPPRAASGPIYALHLKFQMHQGHCKTLASVPSPQEAQGLRVD
ncbi:hypothetical protein NQZ68_026761 [Dissostichus eleginoides]|nr:hypothetical protein NQZ68_026761 [Dissostichus eleginoides]